MPRTHPHETTDRLPATSRSAAIPAAGITTSADLANLLRAVMADGLAGRITATDAKAICARVGRDPGAAAVRGRLG